jgi:hypothetical protein
MQVTLIHPPILMMKTSGEKLKLDRQVCPLEQSSGLFKYFTVINCEEYLERTKHELEKQRDQQLEIQELQELQEAEFLSHKQMLARERKR